MVHQVQLPSKYVVYFLAIFYMACNPTIKENKSIIYANSSLVMPLTKSGITSVNQQPFTGVIFALYLNGDTVFTKPYTNGKEDGMHKNYYPNKQIAEIRTFNNGWKIGEHIGFHENGKRKFQYHFKDDKYEGNIKEWDENGLLFKDMNYANGQEYGSQKTWYSNGKIKANYIIINNRHYGLLGTKNCKNVSDSIINKL